MILFSICGIISIAMNIFSLCYARKCYNSPTRTKRVLTSVQIYTIGLFLSMIALYIPVYYLTYSFGDSYAWIRPFFVSVHHSFRTFILDGEFDTIRNALESQPEPLRVLYSLYSALLYVVAPIMTFTNALSLFQNIVDEVRFWYHRCKKIYILSELNQKSVALAESIRDNESNCVIVFTDVFKQNKEVDYELLAKARDMQAICLKRDVSHLNIAAKKGDVEIFLIGQDEGENVSQAVKITTDLNQCNKKHNVKIFVFSQKESSAYILDSVQYDNLLDYAGGFPFKLRRINEVRQLAWKTIAEMNIFETAKKHQNTVSVLIVGMGSYGMEFFKTLVWFCQFEGIRLKITIADKLTDGDDGKRSVKSMINHQCPDLLKYNRSEKDGDAYYDIEILSGIDMETSSFEEIVSYQGNDVAQMEMAQRIKNTDIAFVSLGDDDLNIETSVRLRSFFDKLHGVKADKSILLEEEVLQIYSVVYDEQKSGILHQNDDVIKASYLKNHCNIPYHIHFIGGMSSQYHYKNLYDAQLEAKAYGHHVGWVDVMVRIYQEQEEQAKAEKLTAEYDDPKKQEEEKKKYEKHEYYRLSSMAKEIYKSAVGHSFADAIQCQNSVENQSFLQTCMCDNCVKRKKSEHMRWNAYIRTIGYSYQDGVKAYRAKLHSDLVSWAELSEEDKMKD